MGYSMQSMCVCGYYLILVCKTPEGIETFLEICSCQEL